MKFFSTAILSLFVAVVAAQDGLDFGGQCGTIVGTVPCKAGLKCCYIGPDNGKCTDEGSKTFLGDDCLFES